LERTRHDKTQRAPSTRLYALLAREGRCGVIFRRGPSKQVQLIRWDLRTDTFEHGQWFKGRIYERRCDLSPSGRLLVYFASTQRGAFGTWTALSRPPFFTALALWPKGDAWGGGGMFEDERTLLLNHAPLEGRTPFPMPAGFALAPDMRVRPFGHHPGRGEDEPIDSALRQRDGWEVMDVGESERDRLRGDTFHRFSRPRISEKQGVGGRRLQAVLHAIGRSNAPWYSLDYRVMDRDGVLLLALPDTDWADWDGGDLVFARGGCLYRLVKSDIPRSQQEGAPAFRLLHDFRGARFAPLAASAEASKY
jgi:hypothetical protein